MSKEFALTGRDDVSRFMVHLTRDDRADFKDGGRPRRNLLDILKSREIIASNAHCFYNNRLKALDKKTAEKFSVACFTETPLNQLHLLVQRIPNRQIKLKSYRIVFTREFIVRAGGQPALYINGYGDNKFLHQCARTLYDNAFDEHGDLISPNWRILPFINAMHERYDFSWEREWRVLDGLTFSWKDIVCVILPEDGEDDMKEGMATAGIATISPGWGYEQIVAELARQQRSTRRLQRELQKLAK
jgi:hypothetical protein